MPMLGIFLATFAGAAASSDVGIRPKPRATVCHAMSVTSPQAPKTRQRFSAARILDLQFQVAVDPKVQGPHRMGFKVFTPHGHLYQELSVGFRSEGDKHARTQSGRLSVKGRLPVAGTSITNNSLFGTWKVIPHLDGDLTPCGAAAKFSIAR